MTSKINAKWSVRDTHYVSFIPALDAGMAKLNEYYQQSAASDTHIMAMGNTFLFPLVAYTILIRAPWYSPQTQEEDGAFYKAPASQQS